MTSLEERAREWLTNVRGSDNYLHDPNIPEMIAAFALQVAREERERCAKVCESLSERSKHITRESDEVEIAYIKAPLNCAAAIRSLEDSDGK